MPRKIALFAFNGEPMWFAHAMLNALDMLDKGHDVTFVIEGCATQLVMELEDPDKPFSDLYQKLLDSGLISCVCRACAARFGSLESAQRQGLRVCGEMTGHPSMADYLAEGYEIIIL